MILSSNRQTMVQQARARQQVIAAGAKVAGHGAAALPEPDPMKVISEEDLATEVELPDVRTRGASLVAPARDGSQILEELAITPFWKFSKRRKLVAELKRLKKGEN